MIPIETLLAGYPRRRAPLSEAHQNIYEQEYRLNRSGASPINRLAMGLEGWMHKEIVRQGIPGSVLELGAGSLNHLSYETAEAWDAVEPFQALYEDSPNRGKVRRIFGDVSEIPANAKYKRVISVAVLEHLERLPEIIARSALLLEEGGICQHGIPSEGGFLWGLSWRLTTGIGYRLRTGLPYGVLMRHEHLNDAREILAILGWFFEDVSVRRFPLPFFHLSFYTCIKAARPRRAYCEEYLSRLGK